MSENPMSSTKINKVNIAVNRFGYGARGDELEQADKDPKKWLKAQLRAISFIGDFPHSNDILIEQAKFQKERKRLKKQPSKNNTSGNMQDNKMIKNFSRLALLNMSADTLKQAIVSSNSVSWRLLDFFSNHFSVTANGRLMVGLAATLEREAIAPNLLGNFEEMLLAVEQHPAMLIYLNNEKSFGPHSRLAKKHKKGLNENLAREIMELHTLGVDGGYSQADVIELAKGITGWSVKRPGKERGEGFVFRAYGHEPGARTLLGKKYGQQGITQGQQMLRDLAMNPATAKYVCFKLAHHFVSQNPPASLLKSMEDIWLKNHGNIKAVMNCLFDAEEAWLDTAQKYKSPREFVISTMRALSLKKFKDKALLATLTNLGQQPFNAGSPAGFSDDEQDWLGASALMARIDWSSMVSGYQKRVNAEKVMSRSLGKSISELTYNSVMRAESRQQALTLLLMSPEFQRR
jgi:uncharacterized protein (DUF1800 family)